MLTVCVYALYYLPHVSCKVHNNYSPDINTSHRSAASRQWRIEDFSRERMKTKFCSQTLGGDGVPRNNISNIVFQINKILNRDFLIFIITIICTFITIVNN